MEQYIVYALDHTDAQAPERRLKARPLHMDKLKALKANNNLIFAGALLDNHERMIGSSVVVQFETPEELRDWLEAEPYVLMRVWDNIEVHPLKLADI